MSAPERAVPRRERPGRRGLPAQHRLRRHQGWRWRLPAFGPRPRGFGCSTGRRAGRPADSCHIGRAGQHGELLSGGHCVSVGAASPRIALPDRIWLVPNVPGWGDMHLAGLLQDHLGCRPSVPPMPKLWALAEWRRGSLAGATRHLPQPRHRSRGSVRDRRPGCSPALTRPPVRSVTACLGEGRQRVGIGIDPLRNTSAWPGSPGGSLARPGGSRSSAGLAEPAARRGLALAIARAAGAILASGRPWDWLLTATALVAGCLVAATAAGMADAAAPR